MFKNMRLGAKIACGFGTILVIFIALGGVAIWNMREVRQDAVMLDTEFVPEVISIVQLEEDTREMMYELRGYGYTGDNKFLEAGKKTAEQIRKDLPNVRELAAKSPHLVKLKEVISSMENHLQEYDRLIDSTQARVEGLAGNRKMMDDAAAQFMKHAYDYLDGQNKKMAAGIEAGAEPKVLNERLQKITLINDVIDLGNAIQFANFRAQALRDSRLTQEALGHFPKIEQKLSEILAMTTQDSDKKHLADIGQAAQVYKTAMTDPSGNYQALMEINDKRRDAGNGALATTKETTHEALQSIDKTTAEVAEEVSQASRLMYFGLGLSVLLGMALTWFITRGITRTMNRIVASLSDGAEQVATASGQVSSASQQLAEGSSEQAASLEETSSSLEEMTSMTRQNADNANQANSLMNDAGRVVDKAGRSMTELTAAMKEISTASEETAKILKTIDEIAFQTNLLALNAAVEAARAGEAGAGFAVVADEVRNLALRAAEAAKNTALLIEGTVNKVKEGAGLVERTAQDFSQVAGSTVKVNELVGEIAAASNEQAQGVEQISKAVAEMDKVVQQNAANAEESAGASEELSAQAEQMKENVMDLVALVGAGKRGVEKSQRAGSGNGAPKGKAPWPQKAVSAVSKERPAAVRGNTDESYLPVSSRGPRRAPVTSAEEVIPFDNDDMKAF